MTVARHLPAIYIQWESSHICLHLATSFGVCDQPMCPYTVFNITPTKWGHARQKLMKHIWGFHFALFPTKASSRSGLHTGYEKSVTSRGSARKVQSNIIWCLTPITTLERKCWELVCVLLWAEAVETMQGGRSLSLPSSNCWLYRNWHVW